MQKDYWEGFYNNSEMHRTLNFPSQFASFFLSHLIYSNVSNVIECGSGNARDSVFLARYFKKYFAIDFSKEAIQSSNIMKKNLKIENLEFFEKSIVSSDSTLFLKNLRVELTGVTALYSRFFLHALTDTELEIYIKNIKNSMLSGDCFYFEFRTDVDEKNLKVAPKHFRNFLNLNKVVELLKSHGLLVKYSISGYGMANYGEEDAHVARVIGEFK